MTIAAAASATNSHHNQGIKIEAMRMGKATSAVKILFIYFECGGLAPLWPRRALSITKRRQVAALQGGALFFAHH
jgi:hypothetical protein